MSDLPEVFAETVDAIGGVEHQLVHVNMFGKHSAKLAEGKPFLSFMDHCMVYKIGADRVQELLAEFPECQPFDPSGKGRPFKDWIQVPEGAGPDWVQLGQEALVAQLQGSMT